MSDKPKTVTEHLNSISYENDEGYIPSRFSLDFVNFIKLVNGGEGEENRTPVMHYRMLDTMCGDDPNVCNMACRGSAKTSLAEYLFLYLGVYGELPGFGTVFLALYVGDSIENGVKNMRKTLEFRWENSDFLRKYIPETRFTDNRYEFTNIAGKKFIVKAYGAKTGLRGSKEMGKRPTLAILDDLISDDDARSQTVIAAVEDVVYKAVDYALHPSKSKIIWSGTPFNARDPLYKAVESGAWTVNVFPVCEQFPCKRDEFKSVWPDRFTYNYVWKKYKKAVKAGKTDTFNQELMLRIMSEEERIIMDSDIRWYPRESVISKISAFNTYITTDFATGEDEASDFSCINVWALNNKGFLFWIDGYCRKSLMDRNLDELFRLAQKWKIQSAGLEIAGQQKGFVKLIQNKMIDENNYFGLAKAIGSSQIGLRPVKDKMSRFQQSAVPLFKAGKIFFPEELKTSEELAEILDELNLATVKGFKSKHDDQIDTITMLGEMEMWRPSEVTTEDETEFSEGVDEIWDDGGDIEEESSSYFV